MPTDNRATAERIAREVTDRIGDEWRKWLHCDATAQEQRIRCVLAGLAHRDRTAEREAAKKAWDAAIEAAHFWAVPSAFKGSMERERDRYLAAEFDAGERVTRKHEGDFFGVPLYSDPNCPADRVVFEYDGHAVATALIHPDSTVLRRNAEQRGAER